MHRFALIIGDSNRPYYEASPSRDIYICEKCMTKVNAAWLLKHPEEICPIDEISEWARKHPEEARLISQS
jgi:hypothetical protein